MMTLRAGSRDFPMVTITCSPPPSYSRLSLSRGDNGRSWEWEISAIRTGDPDESGCYSPWSDYERLYFALSLRETLVVARFFYSNTTDSTNCFVTFSSFFVFIFVASICFPSLFSATVKRYYFSFQSEHPQSLNALGKNVRWDFFSYNRVSFFSELFK